MSEKNAIFSEGDSWRNLKLNSLTSHLKKKTENFFGRVASEGMKK
jgi:hypothetical protein